MLRVSTMLSVDLACVRLPLIISLPPKKTPPIFLTQLACFIFLSPAVAKIALHFESVLWTVFRQLMPDISLQGCLFHWTQAFW